MTQREPDKIWWTPNELADAKLPDMPKARQAVQKKIDRELWKEQPEFARKRAGRGGGWEYNWQLLPMRAQQKLLATQAKKPDQPKEGRGEIWETFSKLTQTAKDKAADRLKAIEMIEALERGNATRDLAVNQVAGITNNSPRTLWNWLSMIEGVRLDDRLPYLAPRHSTASRGRTRAVCDDDAWEVLKSDFLRPEKPSFSTCYRRTLKIAKTKGWAFEATERTLRRRLEAEVPMTTIVLCRKGVDALKAMYPAQKRDRTALHALEAVNADYHRFDVFVRWPEGEGSTGGIVRPQLVAFQDIYSGRILSWRVDQTPNKVGVSLALGDMIDRFGIPDHVLLDNGREFANKFLTGGIPNRFRFKVKDDDIPGILKVLGCQIHWATPYSGQSKPIERAFRDFCDNISKDPRFAGAYTGNRPDAKPENYGDRAIPLKEFLEVVAEGVEEHNNRTGRRSQTANGRSFVETFEASYAVSPIRRATEEQKRLWMMGAEGLKVDSRSGILRLFGNEYWAPWLHDHMGEKVVARFDPAALRDGLHVDAISGEFLGHVPCTSSAGFFDLEEARTHSAARNAFIRAEKKTAEAQRKLKAAELGTLLDEAKTPGPVKEPIEAKVVRPVFEPKRQPKRPVETAQISDAERDNFAATFIELRQTQLNKQADRDDADNFAWATELEERLAAGDTLTARETRQLEAYQSTPEYKVRKRMSEVFEQSKSSDT